jgi:1-deoxy-D-xylulose-5-phosphate reductoisomerase
VVSVPVAASPAERVEPSTAPRRVTILGATGSIGTSTLSVIADRPEAFAVEAVTAFGNAERLARVAKEAKARIAVIADRSAYDALSNALAGSGIEAAAGAAAIEEAASRPVDMVVAGIVGSAGLAPTMAAIRAGSKVALANKECLVCAGDLFMGEARKAGVKVLPVDSEHNAVFQALDGHSIDDVDRIVLTGSGGPFRDWTKEAMAGASPDQALKHPNWSMGPKISIDSATLMNKGLEVIEAHYLFGVPEDRLEVVVHPQSIIHGMVAYKDGAVIAQMGAPDMRMPIAHCLSWPGRSPIGGPRLDLARIGRFTFERPDLDRFPALKIARAALGAGSWATNILNAANEVAVAAYLAGTIGFLEIARMVEETIERAAAQGLDKAPATIRDALALDREGRRLATGLLAKRETA